MCSPEYIAGLFDGEGCVCIYFSRDSPNFLATKPLAQISVNHADHVFEELKKRFGGCINRSTKTPTWRIGGIQGCLNFMEAILPYLHVKKDTCRVFVGILTEMIKGVHYTDEGILWIAKQRDRLHHGNSRYKWTLGKIKQFLKIKKKRQSRFTTYEDAFISEYCENHTDEEIATKLNRPVRSITGRRRRLGKPKITTYSGVKASSRKLVGEDNADRS